MYKTCRRKFRIGFPVFQFLRNQARLTTEGDHFQHALSYTIYITCRNLTPDPCHASGYSLNFSVLHKSNFSLIRPLHNDRKNVLTAENICQ